MLQLAYKELRLLDIFGRSSGHFGKLSAHFVDIVGRRCLERYQIIPTSFLELPTPCNTSGSCQQPMFYNPTLSDKKRRNVRISLVHPFNGSFIALQKHPYTALQRGPYMAFCVFSCSQMCPRANLCNLVCNLAGASPR